MRLATSDNSEPSSRKWSAVQSAMSWSPSVIVSVLHINCLFLRSKRSCMNLRMWRKRTPSPTRRLRLGIQKEAFLCLKVGHEGIPQLCVAPSRFVTACKRNWQQLQQSSKGQERELNGTLEHLERHSSNVPVPSTAEQNHMKSHLFDYNQTVFDQIK